MAVFQVRRWFEKCTSLKGAFEIMPMRLAENQPPFNSSRSFPAAASSFGTLRTMPCLLAFVCKKRFSVYSDSSEGFQEKRKSPVLPFP